MPADTYYKSSLLFLLFFLFLLLPVSVSALVNINTAGSSELQTLDGIGPAYAQRIIDYRIVNGLFQNIEEIMNVSGIGTVTFNNIKDFITIGSVGSVPDSNTNTSTTQSTTTSSSSNSSTSSGSVSSGSAASLASSSSLSAGRDRVVAVGMPVEFRVESSSKSGIFKWNFGDGTQGGGTVTTHVYEYPGDYVVVLSTNLSDGEATSRVNVSVIEPQVVVSFASPDRIELSNASNQEVNLFGRAISSRSKVFMFPKGTIIRPGAKVSFSSRITGLTPFSVGEVDWVVIGETRDVYKVEQMVEAKKEEKIANIKNEIGQLEQRLAVARANNIPTPSAPSNVPAVAVAVEDESVESEGMLESNLATVVTTVELDNGINWWEKVKRFFLRTQ